tara:strand:- start:1809 stop:2132 length:324 start_codon:yes stop_codon:yes gene_type:complete
MGIFGKLFGKKKTEDFSMPELPSDIDEGGAWSAPELEGVSRRDEMAEFHVPEINQPTGRVSGERFEGSVSPKDIQLILSKLDLISSRLDNLNRRFENMESGNKKDVW